MNLRRTCAFLAFAALSAVPAWAQDVKPVEVNLGGGFTIPYSDAKESFGTGGNLQFGVVFNPSSVVGIQVNYGYTKFGGKDIAPNFTVGDLPPGGIITSVPLTINHTMHDGDFSLLLSTGGDSVAKGYAIVGGGVYHQIINV